MNSTLFKKARMLAVPQPVVGTAATLAAGTPILPVETPEWNLDRGSPVIERSNIMFGFPGTLKSARGAMGWSMSANTEMHDIPPGYTGFHPVLALLLACGLEGSNLPADAGWKLVLARNCFLRDFDGDPPLGPCVLTAALIEDCGVSRFAQDVTGTATLNMNVGEPLMIQAELVGRLLQAGNDPSLSVIETTGTELAYGIDSLEFWTQPYIFQGAVIEVDGEEPVDLQDLAIDLAMNVDEIRNPAAVGGMGIVKPENTAGVQVSFNVAQDAFNRASFWNKFFAGEALSLKATVSGPLGGVLEIESKNLCHAPPERENVNERTHYGIQAHTFLDPEALATDVDDAFDDFLTITYTKPVTTS